VDLVLSVCQAADTRSSANSLSLSGSVESGCGHHWHKPVDEVCSPNTAHRQHCTSCDEIFNLCEEVQKMCRDHSEARWQQRRFGVIGWRLHQAKLELQSTARASWIRERRLEELDAQKEELEALLAELKHDVCTASEECEHGRQMVRELRQQLSRLKAENSIPTQIKKQSSSVMKSLDAEGLRLNTKKQVRSLQTHINKLHKLVQSHAPEIWPLVELVNTSVEHECARYKWLEENHLQLFQRLQHAVARGVLK